MACRRTLQGSILLLVGSDAAALIARIIAAQRLAMVAALYSSGVSLVRVKVQLEPKARRNPHGHVAEYQIAASLSTFTCTV